MAVGIRSSIPFLIAAILGLPGPALAQEPAGNPNAPGLSEPRSTTEEATVKRLLILARGSHEFAMTNSDIKLLATPAGQQALEAAVPKWERADAEAFAKIFRHLPVLSPVLQARIYDWYEKVFSSGWMENRSSAILHAFDGPWPPTSEIMRRSHRAPEWPIGLGLRPFVALGLKGSAHLPAETQREVIRMAYKASVLEMGDLTPIIASAPPFSASVIRSEMREETRTVDYMNTSRISLLAQLSSYDPTLVEMIEKTCVSGTYFPEMRKAYEEPLRILERKAEADPQWALRADTELEIDLPSAPGKKGVAQQFRWPARRRAPLPAGKSGSTPALERYWARMVKEGSLEHRMAGLELLANARGDEPGIQALLLYFTAPGFPANLRQVATARLAAIAQGWARAPDGESVVTRTTHRGVAQWLETTRRSHGKADDADEMRAKMVRALNGMRADDTPAQLAAVRELMHPRPLAGAAALDVFHSSPPTDPVVQGEIATALLRVTDASITQRALKALELGFRHATTAPSPETLSAIARLYLKQDRFPDEHHLTRMRIEKTLRSNLHRLPEEMQILLWEGLSAKQHPFSSLSLDLKALLSKIPPPVEQAVSGQSALDHCVIKALTHSDPEVRAAADWVLARWEPLGPEAGAVAKQLRRQAAEYGVACPRGLLRKVVGWLKG